MTGESGVTDKDTMEIRDEIERLQGSGLAMEFMFGIFVHAISDAGFRAAIVEGINDLPGVLSDRYGLDSKPAFKRGIEEAVANVSRHLGGN